MRRRDDKIYFPKPHWKCWHIRGVIIWYDDWKAMAKWRVPLHLTYGTSRLSIRGQLFSGDRINSARWGYRGREAMHQGPADVASHRLCDIASEAARQASTEKSYLENEWLPRGMIRQKKRCHTTGIESSSKLGSNIYPRASHYENELYYAQYTISRDGLQMLEHSITKSQMMIYYTHNESVKFVKHLLRVLFWSSFYWNKIMIWVTPPAHAMPYRKALAHEIE